VTLPEKILALHQALDGKGVSHAFGGALALAWCTQRARGTIDIDVNLFVPPDRAREVLLILPPGVAWTDDDVERIEGEGQARLWWDTTPIDAFFSTTAFHAGAASRIRREPFLGVQVPFLACRDLAVFKAFFDRTQDWADLEAMAAAGSLDIESVLGALTEYLGGVDPRVARLRALARR
jgi:hypothetical protein